MSGKETVLRRLKRFIENKFAHLLAVLLVFFLFTPFIEHSVREFPIVSLIFLCAVLITLRVMLLPRHIFRFSVIISVSAFLLDFLLEKGVVPCFRGPLTIITAAIYALFMVMAIVIIMKSLFATSRVTVDTILGGICVYFLIGYVWSLSYYVIWFCDRAAFSRLAMSSSPISFFYFSFTTLTTTGYGDIYPTNNFAMMMANLESIVGQMYLTIFVARLVGLHITHGYNKGCANL